MRSLPRELIGFNRLDQVEQRVGAHQRTLFFKIRTRRVQTPEINKTFRWSIGRALVKKLLPVFECLRAQSEGVDPIQRKMITTACDTAADASRTQLRSQSVAETGTVGRK